MIDITPEFEQLVTDVATQVLGRYKNEIIEVDTKRALDNTAEETLALMPNDMVVARDRLMLSFESSRLTDRLTPWVYEAYPDSDPRVSGHFYYPPGGYMGWHTNSDKPQRHLYITWCDEDHQSFFRYSQDDEVKTDWDSAGVNVRVFDVTDREPFYWHCVYSNCNRVSFGFRLMPR